MDDFSIFVLQIGKAKGKLIVMPWKCAMRPLGGSAAMGGLEWLRHGCVRVRKAVARNVCSLEAAFSLFSVSSGVQTKEASIVSVSSARCKMKCHSRSAARTCFTNYVLYTHLDRFNRAFLSQKYCSFNGGNTRRAKSVSARSPKFLIVLFFNWAICLASTYADANSHDARF